MAMEPTPHDVDVLGDDHSVDKSESSPGPCDNASPPVATAFPLTMRRRPINNVGQHQPFRRRTKASNAALESQAQFSKMQAQVARLEAELSKVRQKLQKAEMELKGTQKNLRALKKKASEEKLLIAVAEYAHKVLTQVEKAQERAQEALQARLEKHFQQHKHKLSKDGPTPQELAEQHSSWLHLSKYTRKSLCNWVREEEDKVRRWRQEGEKEEDAPFTPHLDRVRALCEEAPFDTATYIRLLKLYAWRSSVCHEDVVTASSCVKKEWEHIADLEGRINWRKLRRRYVKHKGKIDQALKVGKIAVEVHETCIDALQACWGLYADSSLHSKVIRPSRRSRRIAEAACDMVFAEKPLRP